MHILIQVIEFSGGFRNLERALARKKRPRYFLVATPTSSHAGS